MAAAPLFREAGESSLESWLMEGLDRLFAADERIEKVYFDLWASYYYDDNSNYDFKGSASFRFRQSESGDDNMTEDELDEIPAVRMLERRAVELWGVLPITVDSEGSTRGEYSLHAERGLIKFEYSPDEEAVFRMEIAFRDGAWAVTETISIPMNGSVTLVDLAANDHEESFAQNFDADEYRLKRRPQTTSVTLGEDDETIVYHLVPGCLAAEADPDE